MKRLSPTLSIERYKQLKVLLSKDLRQKISHFGLAKLIPPILFSISSCCEISEFSGLLVLLIWFCSGYVAPERGVRNKVTTKSDVYSFGALLLEIVSGRLNRIGHLSVEEHNLLIRESTNTFLYENMDPSLTYLWIWIENGIGVSGTNRILMFITIKWMETQKWKCLRGLEFVWGWRDRKVGGCFSKWRLQC